jgi:hypothetical protein
MSPRFARGSMPWPVQLDARSACRGSITTETVIPAGAKLRITAWRREDPNGEPWLGLELEPYPGGGRKPTAHNPRSPHQPKE